jgi:predicted methyltransferase
VFFIMSYHDLYWRPKDGSWPATDPAALLKQVHAALKPGGVVIVEDHVDVAGADPLVNVDKVHRIDPVRLRKDFEKAGFKFDGESKALAHPTTITPSSCSIKRSASRPTRSSIVSADRPTPRLEQRHLATPAARHVVGTPAMSRPR